MKNIFLLLLVAIIALPVCAQKHRAEAEKRLVITDVNTGGEVKRINFTKIFSYKIKNSDIWRNGFVTGFEKKSAYPTTRE